MFRCELAEDHAPAVVPCGCHGAVMTQIQRRFDVWMAQEQSAAGAAARTAIAHEAPGRVPAPQAGTTAFDNIRLFDGVSVGLREGVRVIVEGGRILSLETSALGTRAGMLLIDGGGRVLMPGLIDAHWHAIMARPSVAELMSADVNYIHALAVAEAEATLLRGFTTVRDCGGPTFGLKRAIDEGVIPGPRLYPSGALISQTAGHGDFRPLSALPRTRGDPLDHSERHGFAALADDPAEVRRRAREQLMRGASQLKYMAGGGVSSLYDPLDVTEGTVAEMRAAVEAAENWGTYVTVHAYTPRAMQMAMDAGVRCIEHGQLADEATARMIADRGVWWSLQPFLDDEDANPQPPGPNRIKQLEVSAGTDRAYELAKLYKARTAWGTDTLFDARLTTRQGAQLAKMTRWYEPVDVLRMATSINGELMAFCGPRNPYPARLGVVEAGAAADLLLVDGDPLTDIGLIADPDANFRVIMKDGRIFKNTLP